MDDLPEHVAVNREYWDGMADQWVEMGERAWLAAQPPPGGSGRIPESEVDMLPDDMTGMQPSTSGAARGTCRPGW